MKKNIRHCLFIVIACVAITMTSCSNKTIAQSTTQPDNVTITYQNFYDGLSPYGTWIDYPAYGHVWHPGVGADFRPYATNGHWLYSTGGWAWASDYSWGWAPFHYGRWVFDDAYGWLWIPGYEWSPAWVTWGYYDNYYCWAPLMPGIQLGVSIDYRPHPVYWNVVNRSHIYDNNIGAVVEKKEVVNNIQNNITVINNYSNTTVHNQVYSKGPDVAEVQKYTTQQIKPVAIHPVSIASETKLVGNQLNVYQPKVQHALPKEYKIVVDNNTRPVLQPTDKTTGERKEQADNVNKLPTRTVPSAVFERPHMAAPAAPTENRKKR